MRVFISGGCKNGKSFFAQNLAKQMQMPGLPLYYLATMIPCDEEDRLRIENHQHEREGWGFETVEMSDDISTIVNQCDVRGTFLLDSVTALLANAMFSQTGKVNRNAPQKLASELVALTEKISRIVFVSDFIYSDAAIFDELTETYRQGLALIDRELAKVCDSVLEIMHGTVIDYKQKSSHAGERR